MMNQGYEYRRALADSMKGSREQREFTVAGLECRSLDSGTLRMSGYASLTESPYKIGGGDRSFTEVIKRKAFSRTLAENPDTVLLLNHDGLPLARTTNGSLALAEDSRGLHWTADLDPGDPTSMAVARRVESGILDQCSMAFVCTSDSWSDDFKHRAINSVSLHRGDVSVVNHAANAATSVGLRSASMPAGRSIPIPDRTSRARQDLVVLQRRLGIPARPGSRPTRPVALSRTDYRARLSEIQKRVTR